MASSISNSNIFFLIVVISVSKEFQLPVHEVINEQLDKFFTILEAFLGCCNVLILFKPLFF